MKRLGHRAGSPGRNTVSMYDVDSHIAEIYDRAENYTNDVDLIRTLIGERKGLQILEPFCGTGRILIPLAVQGHSLVGMDRATAMLDGAKAKSERLSDSARRRIQLIRADVLSEEWPGDFDVVILGGNCLYELATFEEQERCVANASRSLRKGGCLYLDNNHMEGPLAVSWRKLDIDEKAFPTGECEDGTVVRSWRQRIGFDGERRLVTYRRNTTVILRDGRRRAQEYVIHCHPPSTAEMKNWLDAHGFVVESLYGDRSGGAYDDSSDRAIFWARKDTASVTHEKASSDEAGRYGTKDP